MHGLSLKQVIACGWILLISALGVLYPVVTMSGWIALVGVGLLPPVLLLRAWKRPSQTMSEEIQQALRK